MRPDRDLDWRKRLDREKVSTVRERKPDLLAVKRTALSVTQITGDEHWDHFLSVINARIEKQQEQMDVALERLKSSDNFTTEDLINEKLAVRLLGREIEALRWVIGLPQELIENGQRAAELLGTEEESSS